MKNVARNTASAAGAVGAACARWAACEDVRALGRALPPDDLLFHREHPSSCLACARQSGALRALESLAGSTPLDAHQQILVAERAVETVRRSRRPQGLSLRWSWGWLGIGVGGVTASIAVVLLLIRAPAPQPHVAVPSSISPSSVPAGAAQVAYRLPPSLQIPAATARNTINEGDIVTSDEGALCLGLPDGIRLCLGGGSAVRMEALRSTGKRVALLRGKVVASLAPQPKGSAFSIHTDASVVTAVGTVFSVERVPTGHDVVVGVVEGSVVTEWDAAASRRTVRAGEALTVATAALRPLTEPERRATLALAVGMAPSDTFAPSADMPIDVPSDVASDVPSEMPSQRPSVASRPSPASTSARRGSAERVMSPSALMSRAQTLRGEKRYRQAAQVYQTLLRQHPTSSEARASWVSLGTLQLASLRDPAGAVRSFEGYLKTGDPTLRQEASYGRVKALRILGNRSRELQAIEDALRLDTNGIYAAALRERRLELSRSGGVGSPRE